MNDGAGHRMREAIFFLTLTAMSTACTVTRTLAYEDLLYCAQYAQEAVEASQAIEKLRCGFSGPRWTQMAVEHQRFCEQPNVRRQTTESERRERNYAVACCKYSVEATAQVLQAAQRNCGYSGARWSANQQEHLNWCLAAAQGFPEFETQQRNAGLQSCGQRR